MPTRRKRRFDWCNVQRRLARQPHLRCVVAYHAGRLALIRGTAVLAMSPKAAFEVLDTLSAAPKAVLPRAA